MDSDDYIALADLKSGYFLYVDTKQGERLLGILHQDAQFTGFAFADTHAGSHFVETLKTFMDGVHSEHRGSMPRFRTVDRDTVRGLWFLEDHLEWEPNSRPYKGVEIEGLHGIHAFAYYEDEYRRDAGRWVISSSRLVRTRIDLLVGDGVGNRLYDFPDGDRDWVDGW